jgi:AraC-like DNA-binding protein
MNGQQITVRRRESEEGCWENVERAPDESLRAHVLSYQGYTQQTRTLPIDRHVPGTFVPLIIGFGAPLRHNSRYVADAEYRSFVAGLHDTPVATANTGDAAGLQINLTPIGAYLLFGRPMHGLANNVISFEDAFGADAPLLAEALFEARAWDLRFELLDAAIGARFAHAKPASPGVAWALSQIDGRYGNVSVTGLAERLGWSRKHLVSQFREQVGLPPKTYARVARFSRAIEIVRRDEELRWTDVAFACGYYDQAHFIRDFSEFAGVTPTRFVESRRPWDALDGA